MNFTNTNTTLYKNHGLKCINPPGALGKIANDYKLSQSIIVPPNKTIVYCSGHVGLDENMELPSTIEEQIRCAFENVNKSLQAAGVIDGWKSVFHFTSYHTSFEEENMNILMKIHEEYIGTNAPCWTGVCVSELAEGACIELQVKAILE